MCVFVCVCVGGALSAKYSSSNFLFFILQTTWENYPNVLPKRKFAVFTDTVLYKDCNSL